SPPAASMVKPARKPSNAGKRDEVFAAASIISCQLSVVSCQLSVVSCQLSAQKQEVKNTEH
ncbi:MAG: hypothetical protein U9O82_11890, partial [Thermodesulfobacteriota bacterium]|nr:hypothetical protein [Thermodesulfobacteriota bacterium]